MALPLAPIVSSQHRIVAVPPRAEVLNVFSDAKRVTWDGNDYIIVRHGSDETRFLQNLGYEIPAPVLSQYDWCEGAPYEVQKKTAAMLTMCRRAYVLNGMGCVDADTEYLSRSGWQRIADYTGGDVAQYHPDTGEIEFVDPVEYVKLPCDEMIRFKTPHGVDQLLSPEHRVLLADGRVMQAEEIEGLTALVRAETTNSGRRSKCAEGAGCP
jgi:hypothetical protein